MDAQVNAQNEFVHARKTRNSRNRRKQVLHLREGLSRQSRAILYGAHLVGLEAPLHENNSNLAMRSRHHWPNVVFAKNGHIF